MAYVDWTPKLSVGMKDIDEQHKHFIDLINKTKEAVDAHAPRNAQKKILDDLVGYGRYHFETEERYFAKFKYPYAQAHMAAHAELLEQVIVFYDRFEAGEDVALELLDFLKGWLADHLKKHDMKYAEYFKKKGFV
jgi:hemerythrin-like metal-binding protein